jgi:Phytanoyl-CoA dioxygenase (PhyH)
MLLTIDQKNHYHEQGWLVVKGLIPLHEVRKADAEIAGAHAIAWEAEQRDGKLPWAPRGSLGTHVSWDVTIPEGSPQRIEQLMHSDTVSPAMARITRLSGIIDVMDQLMEPDLDILHFHSKTLMRAGEAKSRFPWHQDFGYWHYSHHRPQQINCAVALAPQNVESGCLKYVPGSHKRGLVEHQAFAQKTVSSFPIGLSEDLSAYQAVPVEYEPGDALFFGALVIHGSDINRTGKPAPFNTIAYDVANNMKDPFEEPLVRARFDRLHSLVH